MFSSKRTEYVCQPLSRILFINILIKMDIVRIQPLLRVFLMNILVKKDRQRLSKRTDYVCQKGQSMYGNYCKWDFS